MIFEALCKAFQNLRKTLVKSTFYGGLPHGWNPGGFLSNFKKYGGATPGISGKHVSLDFHGGAPQDEMDVQGGVIACAGQAVQR